MIRPSRASRLTQPGVATAFCLAVLLVVGGTSGLLWQHLSGTTHSQLQLGRDLVDLDRLTLRIAEKDTTTGGPDVLRAQVSALLRTMNGRPAAAAYQPALDQLRDTAPQSDTVAGLARYLDERSTLQSRIIATVSEAEARRSTVLAAAAGLSLVLLVGLATAVIADARRRRRDARPAPVSAVLAAGAYDTHELARDLDAAAKAALQTGSPLACVMVEVDSFAAYAQTQGAASGELMLAEVSDMVSAAVRASDSAYRIDEAVFVLTLPDTECAAAMRLAERLRESIVRSLLKEGITVSAGVAGIPTAAVNATDLLAAAAAALAEATRHGRNQVRRSSVLSDELDAARDNVGRR